MSAYNLVDEKKQELKIVDQANEIKIEDKEFNKLVKENQKNEYPYIPKIYKYINDELTEKFKEDHKIYFNEQYSPSISHIFDSHLVDYKNNKPYYNMAEEMTINIYKKYGEDLQKFYYEFYIICSINSENKNTIKMVL